MLRGCCSIEEVFPFQIFQKSAEKLNMLQKLFTVLSFEMGSVIMKSDKVCLSVEHYL